MSRVGRTGKPCEGCGETQTYGRETGKVCAGCQRLLEEARNAREAAAARRDCGLETFPRPWASHCLGYIHNAGDAGTAFRDTFYKLLLLLLADPAPPDTWTGYGVTHTRIEAVGFRDREDTSVAWVNNDTGYGLIDPALLEAAGAVYKAARELARAAYAEGKDAGSRLLFGLASGEVSIADLNSYESERSAARDGHTATRGFEARCRACRGHAEVCEHDGRLTITCRACHASLPTAGRPRPRPRP